MKDDFPNKIFKSTQHLRTKMRSHTTRPKLETVIFVRQFGIKNTAAPSTNGFFKRLFTGS